MDWRRVFVEKPILLRIAPLLTIEDIFALSCVDRWFYNKWITNGCIDAINMRQLVFTRFRLLYTKKNPFKTVRKFMAAARLPINDGVRRFRCSGGCGKLRSKRDLYDSDDILYAICEDCSNYGHSSRDNSEEEREEMEDHKKRLISI